MPLLAHSPPLTPCLPSPPRPLQPRRRQLQAEKAKKKEPADKPKTDKPKTDAGEPKKKAGGGDKKKSGTKKEEEDADKKKEDNTDKKKEDDTDKKGGKKDGKKGGKKEGVEKKEVISSSGGLNVAGGPGAVGGDLPVPAINAGAQLLGFGGVEMGAGGGCLGSCAVVCVLDSRSTCLQSSTCTQLRERACDCPRACVPTALPSSLLPSHFRAAALPPLTDVLAANYTSDVNVEEFSLRWGMLAAGGAALKGGRPGCGGCTSGCPPG